MGLKITEGLVFRLVMRTNASFAKNTRYKKTLAWSVPGDRAIAILVVGSLWITQGAVTCRQAPYQLDAGDLGVERSQLFKVADEQVYITEAARLEVDLG